MGSPFSVYGIIDSRGSIEWKNLMCLQLSTKIRKCR